MSLAADANAGRVALVTGGGSGIGRATALAFARSGARVAVCGRRPEPLEETRALVEAAGGECLAVAADIREPDAVGTLVGDVLERFGTIDVLVNNAGGQFVAPAEKISDNGWRAVERVTVDATWGVTRTVAERAMIPGRDGLIVFIGFSPRRGTPGMAHAAAGRAAVENLAAGLALEWSRHRIRSVCVAPGSIRSEGLDGYDPELVAGWERSIPLGRLGRAEEVASVIAFLASAGGAYITGTTIVVDGGADAWGMGEPPPPVEGGAVTLAPARRDLSVLFAPASVAVVGASDDQAKWGHWMARGAIRGSGRRRVFLVNRRADTVLGLPAHRSLADLPEPPELVVVAVPPAALDATVDEAIEAGARGVVIITAGFADGDAGGRRATARSPSGRGRPACCCSGRTAWACSTPASSSTSPRRTSPRDGSG